MALDRTIVIEPQVLLLDEHLSNLDAKLRVQMRRELLDLQRKLSLIKPQSGGRPEPRSPMPSSARAIPCAAG